MAHTPAYRGPWRGLSPPAAPVLFTLCSRSSSHMAYFNSLGLKKLPSMQSLKQEDAALQAENKKRYPEYKRAKAEMIELLTAKNNVERILGMTEKEKNRDRQQEAR